MTRALLILRAASLLAPYARRGEWLREWRSELWYIDPRDATTFCLGAFRDAVFVRRHYTRTAARMQSPAACLGFLAAAAALAALLTLAISAPLTLRTAYWRLRPRDLPAACLIMLLFSAILLPATRLAMGSGDGRATARATLFLAMKILLVQPILFSALLLMVLLGPIIPFAPQLGLLAIWILTCRWVLADQRRRCPVCLRLLDDPVRIGAPSETFLEWYGAEAMCARGHGLLHSTETSAVYPARPRWLRLDRSWSGLFRPL
jgi:hypothetical protein